MPENGKNPKIAQANIGALKIIKYPDPRLREVSTAVEPGDDRLRRLVDRMFELITGPQGVGLAAPQVGITVCLFIVSKELGSVEHRVYINPEVLSAEGSRSDEEGCLSVPGITFKIKRSNVVNLRATDLGGRTFEQSGEGLPARVFQHEMDHLDGRLITDRMGTVAKLANRKTLRELEEQSSD